MPFGAHRTEPWTSCSPSVMQKGNTVRYCVRASAVEVIGVCFDSAVTSRMSNRMLIRHRKQAVDQWTLIPYFRLGGALSTLRHVLLVLLFSRDEFFWYVPSHKGFFT